MFSNQEYFTSPVEDKQISPKQLDNFSDGKRSRMFLQQRNAYRNLAILFSVNPPGRNIQNV